VVGDANSITEGRNVCSLFVDQDVDELGRKHLNTVDLNN
jgi:hypothetical protein